jgi:hypothetical protein
VVVVVVVLCPGARPEPPEALVPLWAGVVEITVWPGAVLVPLPVGCRALVLPVPGPPLLPGVAVARSISRLSLELSL